MREQLFIPHFLGRDDKVKCPTFGGIQSARIKPRAAGAPHYRRKVQQSAAAVNPLCSPPLRKSRKGEKDMSTWYSADLGDGVAAYNPSSQIQEVFMPLFAAAGCPKDMAVFSRYDLDANIVTAYFTPSAHAVAKIFNAIRPSRKPLAPTEKRSGSSVKTRSIRL